VTKHRLVLWEVWHSNVCTNVIFLSHTKIAQIFAQYVLFW